MRVDTINYIRNNPPLYQYLKYHSYWYKAINRDSKLLKELEQDMKKEYKLTPEDKINRLNEKMNFISSFLEVLK